MILETKGPESILEAIARETGGRISIHLSDSRNHLLVGDGDSQEVLNLDLDQVLELIDDLTELASHMGEEE